MTLSRRLIVCLDVRGGRVVKGTRFEGLRDVGDPSELAERYERNGADEIVFLDISASTEDRATLLESVRRTAERLFIPLTVGGGIRSVDDAARVLRAGADKVSINSAAIADPPLLSSLTDRFGRQCVVASVDAKRDGDRWRVFSHGGSRPTELDAIEWSARCAALGAGEILVTSIDRDGTRDGYDLELTAAVARVVDVPVIASGGAGCARHVADALRDGVADAALVAGMLHDGTTTVRDLKREMRRVGVPIRNVNSFELDIDALDFDKGGGLVTVVAQDARTDVVLMVAHADREAVELTVQTGEMHYRSRQRGLWRKGATSGNVQRVVTISPDCDGDALLARVVPAGPACHLELDSCFGATDANPLRALDRTIAERASAPGGGYTRRLLADRNLRLKKLGEEAAELVTALADASTDRAVDESSDLVYHVLVALRAAGAGLSEIEQTLARRALKPSS